MEFKKQRSEGAVTHLGRGMERKQLDWRLQITHHFLEGREAVAVFVNVCLVSARQIDKAVGDNAGWQRWRGAWGRVGGRTLHQRT